MHKLTIPLAVGLMGLTTPALAETPMDPAEIDRAVMQFTGAAIGQPL